MAAIPGGGRGGKGRKKRIEGVVSLSGRCRCEEWKRLHGIGKHPSWCVSEEVMRSPDQGQRVAEVAEGEAEHHFFAIAPFFCSFSHV